MNYKKGYFLLEKSVELLIISICILTVLATYARTLLLVKESLEDMIEINQTKNSLIAVIYYAKHEIKEIDLEKSNPNLIIYQDDEGNLTGFRYNSIRNLLSRYRKNVGPSLPGNNPLSYQVTYFNYNIDNQFLYLKFNNEFLIEINIPLKGSD